MPSSMYICVYVHALAASRSRPLPPLRSPPFASIAVQVMGPDSGDNMQDKIILPKLSDDGSNWVDYRDRIVWLLESQNIEQHIDHDIAPSSYTAVGDVGGLKPEERWKKEETNIKQIIGPSLLRSPFSRIKGQKTVHGVWAILKQVYEEKTRALAADLMRRFRNTRCGENDNLRTHFEHLNALKEQLAGMGKVISDEDYADIICWDCLVASPMRARPRRAQPRKGRAREERE